MHQKNFDFFTTLSFDNFDGQPPGFKLYTIENLMYKENLIFLQWLLD